jgi:adenylylsulfate kinase
MNNLIWHKTAVNRSRRENADYIKHKNFVVWFTGLSGSGKSTIAHKVEEILFQSGYKTYVLDGDNLRHGLNSDLSFSNIDRSENIRRAGEVIKLFLDAGIITLAAFISPSHLDRKKVKEICADSDFVEIYCKCSLRACIERDVKGLYKKAEEGLVKNFTGVGSKYEEPSSPNLILNTEQQSIEQNVQLVIQLLQGKKLIN